MPTVGRVGSAPSVQALPNKVDLGDGRIVTKRMEYSPELDRMMERYRDQGGNRVESDVVMEKLEEQSLTPEERKAKAKMDEARIALNDFRTRFNQYPNCGA